MMMACHKGIEYLMHVFRKWGEVSKASQHQRDAYLVAVGFYFVIQCFLQLNCIVSCRTVM
jgi:hypothetical protein